MKLKLAGIAGSLFFAAILFQSCQKDNTGKEVYVNNNIVLSASQVVTTPGNPLPPTTGKGTMQANYDKATRLLNYTITWDTLSGAPIAIHLHAIADSGFLALPTPLGPYAIDSFRANTSSPWIKYAGGIAQKVTLPTSPAPTKKGSVSGSLFADNVVIKEADLLAGKYYVDIHTASNPLFIVFGEIRGQVLLRKQ